MRDLFKERGIIPNEQRDLFAERGIMPPSKSPPSKGFGDYASEFGKGAAQGLENTGIGIADLLPGVNIKQAAWAPDTTAAKAGELISDIGSFFIPGAGIGRAAKAIPHIANAMKSLGKLTSSSKSLNVLSKLGKGSAEGALFGAIQNPEDQLKGAEMGAGLGMSGSVLAQLARTSNPIINALARLTAGGALGYGAGGTTGAEIGAAAGLGAPKIAKSLGFGAKPGLETLEHIQPQDVSAKVAAANELGTPITPAEASANPFVSQLESQYGKSGEAAAEKTKIGLERTERQKNAINRLTTTISPRNEIMSDRIRKAAQDVIIQKEQQLQAKVQPIYDKAYTKKISPQQLQHLINKDPTIENAINSVLRDPAYAREIEGYDPHSIKILDLAKRKINADIAQAVARQDNDRARVLTNSLHDLTAKTDTFSKDYAKARKMYQEGRKPIDELESGHVGKISRIQDTNLKNISKIIFDPAETDLSVLKKFKNEISAKDPEAWKGIVRNEIERRMMTGKGKEGASKFYNQVLADSKGYKQFHEALEGDPSAQKQLANMRIAWENLINLDTTAGAAGKGATGMLGARNDMQKIIDWWHDLTGQKSNKEAVKFIHSPDWVKSFDEISKIKDKRARNDRIAELIGKVLGAGLTPKKMNKE